METGMARWRPRRLGEAGAGAPCVWALPQIYAASERKPGLQAVPAAVYRIAVRMEKRCGGAAGKKKAVRSDSFFPKESEYKKEKRELGSVKIKRNGAPRGRQALQGAGSDSIAPRGMDAAGIGLRRAEGRMVCASAFGLTLRFVVGLLAFDDSIIAILDKNAR